MSAQGDDAATPPTVIYLVGVGRSGSTLLERILGTVPAFVNVGELIDISRRVAQDNEKCGCGEVFDACPFWTSVGRRAFGGWSREVLDRIGTMQGRVARQRHIPRLVNPFTGPPFSTQAADYRRLYASLYSAICAVAERSVVVDASKWPAQALGLAGPEIDLRVVHVVRDVRGVAYSMLKDVDRPHATEHRDTMERTGVVSTSARWSLNHAEVDLLRTKRVPTVKVRYEDLVADAGGEVSRLLRAIGLPAQPGWLSHVRGQQVSLGSSHGLSGNPSRFVEGDVRLRLDDAWRSKLPRRDRLVATMFGLPFSARGSGPSAGRVTSSMTSTQRTEA